MEEYKRLEIVEGQLKGYKDVTKEESFDVDANVVLNEYNQKLVVRNELTDVNNNLKLEVEQKQEVLGANNSKLDEMDAELDKTLPLLEELGLIAKEVVLEEAEEEVVAEE